MTETKKYSKAILSVMLIFCILSSVQNTAHSQDIEPVSKIFGPAKNPPKDGLPGHRNLEKPTEDPLYGSTPTIEWTFHKTSDNAHPDTNEQQMLWLLNNARSNPTQEGNWLATTDIPNIVSARDYFCVDVVMLQNEFTGYDPKPPATFDVRLYNGSSSQLST